MNKKILIVLGLVIIALCVFYFVFFMKIKSKNEHISLLEQDLSLQNKKQDYVFVMRKMVQNADTQIRQINDSIIQQDGEVHFIETLESLARESGITISIDSISVENDPAFADSEITSLKVKAKTEGSWSGTYVFLTQLESMPYKIKIDNFGLVSLKEDVPLDQKRPTLARTNWQVSFQIHVLKYK